MDVRKRKNGNQKEPTSNRKHENVAFDDDYFTNKDHQLVLSPAARLFHSPKFCCYVVVRMGTKTRINVETIKAGLMKNFPNHPRFSSRLVNEDKVLGEEKRWERVTLNIEDHIIVPEVDWEMEDADQFVDQYISNLTTSPLDLSRPLWEVHIINVKTSDAQAVAVIRVHHSMGDGASLLSLLLACSRKSSDPDTLPMLPTKKKQEDGSSSDSSMFWRFLLTIWSAITLMRNTLVDVLIFLATALVLKDTNTPMRGPPGVEFNTKRFVHRTVSLDHIKQVKNALNMTINDVILGVTQAGFSRYLNRRYGEYQKDEGALQKGHNNLPKGIRLRANILMNLRPAVGIQDLADMMAKNSKNKWGNKIGNVLLPFTIALQDDPLEYVRGAKSLIDRKKHSLEAFFTYLCANILVNLFGAQVAGAVAHKILCNSTLSFSSLMGPVEEITYYDHEVEYIASNVYGHPQAAHLHFQSYADKMTICISADPDVYPDPEQLLDDLADSLKLIRDAVVDKGLTIAKK
ncbi:wax ester synthase/diacylglycerol acyltransferase 5-like [Argentina anserina]|uniref:wax ester synthase/diacylglycerol acyltransferase 5-like n=1 Tax=Argentina anserina TaxID=57926 RepID=UPI00217667D4|nr:wax ester synthase/diacylglycerol acyltransferase 5-like [Potentilla anserina]